jgi:two-component system LytT family response regulator
LRGGAPEANRRLFALIEELKTPKKYLERLAVRGNGRILLLNIDEIDWIEAELNYVRIHVAAATHLLRESMSRLEAQLDPEQFVRVQRSAIVNLRRIREIQPLFHGEHAVVLRDGTELRWSRRFRKALDELLGRM